MKKNNTRERSSKGQPKGLGRVMTIGLDLGDKKSWYCGLDGEGQVVSEGSVGTTKKALLQIFGRMRRCRMVMEVGTHSPWISRLLSGLGYEVIVANARQLKLISSSSRKDDRTDARELARLARMGPDFLRPIRHRSEETQADLLVIRVREALLEARTKLVNTARGLVKAAGERLPKCDADQLSVERMESLPEWLRERLRPLLEEIESLTKKIKEGDVEIEQIGRNKYPEIALLKQVWGVGTLIALTFVLTIEDKERFQKSRDVGCYVGLRPKRSESGERQAQLGITKEGDGYLRKLLVQGAHAILRRNSPDTDLKRWGSRLAGSSKNAKKRAVVAVARKLAVLLHRLWVSAEVYEPLRNNQLRERQQAAA